MTDKKSKRLEDKLAEMREEEEKRHENDVVKERREKYREKLRRPHWSIQILKMMWQGILFFVGLLSQGVKWLLKED